MKIGILKALAALALGALVVTGAAQAQQAGAGFQALVDGAKREGRLVVWSPLPSRPEAQNAALDAFNKRFGLSTRLEWVLDSDFRFFPTQRDDIFGYVLHPVDLATNKAIYFLNTRANFFRKQNPRQPGKHAECAGTQGQQQHRAADKTEPCINTAGEPRADPAACAVGQCRFQAM